MTYINLRLYRFFAQEGICECWGEYTRLHHCDTDQSELPTVLVDPVARDVESYDAMVNIHQDLSVHCLVEDTDETGVTQGHSHGRRGTTRWRTTVDGHQGEDDFARLVVYNLVEVI